MRRAVQICILLGILFIILIPILANKALAEETEPNPIEDESDPMAILVVRVDPNLPNVEVSVAAIDGGWVKVDDGSWFWNWRSSVKTTTNGQGNARFRIFRLIGSQMVVNIKVNGHTIRRVYRLEQVWKAPTYIETVPGTPTQVVPETPLGPAIASVSMIAALGAFFGIRRKKLTLSS